MQLSARLLEAMAGSYKVPTPSQMQRKVTRGGVPLRVSYGPVSATVKTPAGSAWTNEKFRLGVEWVKDTVLKDPPPPDEGLAFVVREIEKQSGRNIGAVRSGFSSGRYQSVMRHPVERVAKKLIAMASQKAGYRYDGTVPDQMLETDPYWYAVGMVGEALIRSLTMRQKDDYVDREVVALKKKYFSNICNDLCVG